MTSLALLLLAAPSLLQDLETLDRKLHATEQALQTASDELEELRSKTARRQSELADARLRHKEIMATYRARIRALARLPTGARLVVLGRTPSLRDYLRTSRLLRHITAADRRVAKARQDEENRIAELESEAMARESHAVALEDALRGKRDELATLRAQKLDFIKALPSDPHAEARLRAEAAAARRALLKRVRSLKPSGRLVDRFDANQQKLPWPVAGTVVAEFGATNDSQFGTRVKRMGLDFSARAGSTVQSIAPGQVVYADWMRGYGQLVIVDHGHDYHTLYAHLGETRVAAGDSVSVGSPVGTVGDTGSLRGTLLYFEIRNNGQALNPIGWLRPE